MKTIIKKIWLWLDKNFWSIVKWAAVIVLGYKIAKTYDKMEKKIFKPNNGDDLNGWGEKVKGLNKKIKDIDKRMVTADDFKNSSVDDNIKSIRNMRNRRRVD